MWIEAIISKDDLSTALGQALPLKIHFDEDPKTDRWLWLGSATDIELVAEKGLRVTCPAEVMWSVLGIDVPIKLHTLKVLVRPEVVTKPTGDVLQFILEIEEADIKNVPSLVDRGLVKAINAALASKEMAWDFTKTINNTVALPKMLEPLESLTIRVAWGKKRVDEVALVIAVSFHLTFNRAEAGAPKTSEIS